MALLAAQPIMRSVCLLPDVQVSKTFPGSVDTWYWIPQFPQKHFCLYVDVLLVVRNRDKRKNLICCHDADIPSYIVFVAE